MRQPAWAPLVLAAVLFSAAPARAQEKHVTPEEALKTCDSAANDECVVRFYKDTVEASVIRGRLVFQNYCVLCHGKEGKGDGRAAKLHTPPPFNLTQSVAPREYIEQVVRKGGTAMNRGKGMPPWGDQLTDEQIKDVLNFLFSIRQYK